MQQNLNNRVLVVDDSQFMGQVLKNLLCAENFVVEIARNGREAIEKIKSFHPGVITMDVEMPVMSGLEALEVIMREDPLPVIMVSAQTIRGAEISIRALEMGAFDFIAKPSDNVNDNLPAFKRELIAKIRLARLVSPDKLCKSRHINRNQEILQFNLPNFPAVLAIGASTGGPSALQSILTQLPAQFPLPVLVVQHMPKDFTRMMAERLNSLCNLSVKEAADGDVVRPGSVLIAPGGLQMGLGLSGKQVVVKIIRDAPTPTPYKPSVNLLFKAVAETFGENSLAVILTGMGSDGLESARLLKQRGAFLVAEAEESCIVYGMPKAVIDAGLADKILPLSDIGSFLANVAR